MKIAKIIIVVVIMVSFLGFMTLSLLGANPKLENSWTPPDYETLGVEQADLNALSLFNEALQNYYDAENVIFVRSLNFKAGLGLLSVATQQTIEITKINGDETFHQVTKQGTLLGKTNEGYRFYASGTNGYEFKEDNDTRFPKLGVEDWSELTYEPYAGTLSLTDRVDELKRFLDYTINLDALSSNHNNKVYKYKNKFYLSFTINCMNTPLGGIHSAVEESIMNALGDNALPGTFEWKADTKLYIEISLIDGKYLITARRLEENYAAKQPSSNLTIQTLQSISGSYSYNSLYTAITEAEKMNLA